MIGHTPYLIRNLQPIRRLARTEVVGPSTAQPNTAHQKWQAVSEPIPLEESPVIYVDKIKRRRALLQDRWKGETPYTVYQYIRRGNEVGLLDSKRFAAMPAVEGDTTVARTRSNSRGVNTRTGGWRVRWKNWTNIRKN